QSHGRQAIVDRLNEVGGGPAILNVAARLPEAVLIAPVIHAFVVHVRKGTRRAQSDARGKPQALHDASRASISRSAPPEDEYHAIFARNSKRDGRPPRCTHAARNLPCPRPQVAFRAPEQSGELSGRARAPCTQLLRWSGRAAPSARFARFASMPLPCKRR